MEKFPTFKRSVFNFTGIENEISFFTCKDKKSTSIKKIGTQIQWCRPPKNDLLMLYFENEIDVTTVTIENYLPLTIKNQAAIMLFGVKLITVYTFPTIAPDNLKELIENIKAQSFSNIPEDLLF